MKIAVITPTIASRSSFLKECVQSVLNQTTNIPILHLVGEDINKVGCGIMRNQLVSFADPSYDWIAFLDDDDLMLPQHLELLSQHCDTADIIYSDCETIGWEKSWNTIPFNREIMQQRNYIPVTVLMRRSLFESMGGFAYIFAEDWDLWKRCSSFARFTFVPQVTWQYRRIGESMLTTGSITQIQRLP